MNINNNTTGPTNAKERFIILDALRGLALLGIGLGLSVGLVTIELLALAVFLCQVLLSHIWLQHFRFGPLEWLWRMFTYGSYFPLMLTKNNKEAR